MNTELTETEEMERMVGEIALGVFRGRYPAEMLVHVRRYRILWILTVRQLRNSQLALLSTGVEEELEYLRRSKFWSTRIINLIAAWKIQDGTQYSREVIFNDVYRSHDWYLTGGEE